MNNVLRTLVFDGQVSLTVANTTKAVQKAIQLHKLSLASAYVFGKALSAMTFASAALKGEKGEISLAVKGDGKGGDIAVSGNAKLHLRGYIGETQLQGDAAAPTETMALGENGALTIIRDDGYSRPFVGSCALHENATVDGAFENYYAVSEQLPTKICTAVLFNKQGKCVFAGVAALQPLPFCDEETLQKVEEVSLNHLLFDVQKTGITDSVKQRFDCDFSVWEERQVKYQCNCSRKYLLKVLASLGEAQMRQIIQEDGAVRVHCHYCNKDYSFTNEDADFLFGKKENK